MRFWNPKSDDSEIDRLKQLLKAMSLENQQLEKIQGKFADRQKSKVDRVCGNCRHFKRLGKCYGECRKAPPTVTGAEVSRFPHIGVLCWCGEFEQGNNSSRHDTLADGEGNQ